MTNKQLLPYVAPGANVIPIQIWCGLCQSHPSNTSENESFNEEDFAF